MKKLNISVCMATYNGEKYIKEQLASILSQIGEDDEVVISDDSSIDRTVDIIKSLGDNRIKIYKNTKEKSYTRNFENALEKSLGDIIFLADQDDVWMKNKVQVIKSYLDKYDFVVSDNIIVNEKLEVLNESHFQMFGAKRGFIQNLIFPRYVGACMAFRRVVLEKSLPFPSNFKLSAHDYWISLIAELYFKVYLVREPLVQYRRHGENASNGGMKSGNPLVHKLNVRMYTLYNLLKRYFR